METLLDIALFARI